MRTSLDSQKGLPVWAQTVLGILTLGAAYWAIYLTYHPPIPQNVFTTAANTASTTPLSDILVRSQDFKTDYEKANFLKAYEGEYVRGEGSFENFFGESSYFVIVNFKTSWLPSQLQPSYEIACVLKDSSQDMQNNLLLLRKGQTVYFVGTFSNSSVNGYYYPVINDCTLLKNPSS